MNKITRTLFALIFVALLIAVPRAQLPAATTGQSSEDRIALYQALLDLQNPWTVMCVAAHPDDEDGTSLIVMRRKYGAHTVSLFSTFGEGGQNAIGPELYEELGAIRARETMAAAEIQGSEPHFLGLKDFGYSKSADETFQKWGHEEALRRMVSEIRKLRPDVIITNHSVTNNDHGHHQATARLVVEAFDAAADPKRFPEQLKDGVTTWQVQRLFVRVRGNQAVQNPDRQGGGEKVVTIDPNERDPVRGVVYAEEALRALQKHATQGPWPKSFAEFTARFRAFSGQSGASGQMPLIRYAIVKQTEFLTPLPPASHSFLDGLALTGAAGKQLVPPTIDGRQLTEFVDQRDRVLETLLSAVNNKIFGEEMTSSQPQDVPSDPRRLRMLRRLDNAVATAAGVSARLSVVGNALIPGESARLELTLMNGGTLSVRVPSVASGARNEKGRILLANTQKVNTRIDPSKSINLALKYDTPGGTAVTVPHSTHLYDLDFAGKPVLATALLELNGAKVRIVVGTLVDVLPPVEVRVGNQNPYMLIDSAGSGTRSVKVVATNHLSTNIAAAQISIAPCRNGHDGLMLGSQRVSLAKLERRELEIPLRINSADGITGSANGDAGAPPYIEVVRIDDTSKQPQEPLGGSECFVVSAAHAQVARNLRVGYIRGFDYSLPNALNTLGVESKELSVDEVKTADLSKYNSIIVDNRVYESQPELIAANQKLFDYANAGGNLIVFYHKSDEWNPDPRRNRPQLAPYKLVLGNERITDENAPVTFIEPQHPLLNYPNKIGPEDFVGWIQERGLYYPKDWDPQFHALLQSNDPGEAPLKGGLLVGDYGRGHYIYSSMVWYRQLRAGVPGAYRMLANMISYGHGK